MTKDPQSKKIRKTLQAEWAQVQKDLKTLAGMQGAKRYGAKKVIPNYFLFCHCPNGQKVTLRYK